MMDKLFIGLLCTLVAVTILFLVYIVPKDIERDLRTEQIAKEMGCTYIGSARDLGSVKFLDCDGEIKLIRVRLK